MKKILLTILLMVTTASSCAKVQENEYNDNRSSFWGFLYPLVLTANIEISKERIYVERAIKVDDRVESLCIKYNVDACRRDDLLERINVVPASIVMAQAAKTSEWGTVHFSREGNNYFNQFCYQSGCGIEPTERVTNAYYELRKFDTAKESVAAYMLNVNSNPAYEDFRVLRTKSGMVDGYTMASGLANFSDIGESYVDEIRDIMTQNNLYRFDESMKKVLYTIDIE